MAKSGDQREELITEGQSLVYSLAHRIRRSVPVRVELDDLVAYGEVGLAEAARDFDPEHGTQFTTFAYYRIRGAIYDGLAQMTWTSRAQYRRLRYERMATEVLSQDAANASHPEAAPLDAQASWFRGVTEKLAVVYLSSQAADQPSVRDSGIVDTHTEAGPTVVAQREICQKLVELVDALPSQANQLIRSVYFDGFTLQQAADRLGISKSWASRLHAKVLEQLAFSLRKMGAADG